MGGRGVFVNFLPQCGYGLKQGLESWLSVLSNAGWEKAGIVMMGLYSVIPAKQDYSGEVGSGAGRGENRGGVTKLGVR